MYFIGIDWSSSYNDISILDETGKNIKHLKADVSGSGFAQIQETLDSYSAKPADFCIAIETHQNILADYFIEKGYCVYSLNPFCVSKYKESQRPDPKKDDRYDSYVIAYMLFREGQNYKPVVRSGRECEELKVHCDTVSILIKDRTRLVNNLRDNLRRYFPAFSAFFSDMDSSVCLNILKLLPTPDDFLNISEEEYLEKVKNIKYLSNKRSLKIFEYMKENCICMNTASTSALSVRCVIIADQILQINAAIAETDKLIKNIYENHALYKVFDSLPGTGPRLGPQLLAHFGDNHARFDSFQSVQCYAGTAPVTQSSGKSFYSVKMRRACNKSFRNVFYQLAFCSLQKKDSWISKEYYMLKDTKKKTHSTALRIVSNKLVKITYAMWRDGSAYNDTIFEGKRKKNMDAA